MVRSRFSSRPAAFSIAMTLALLGLVSCSGVQGTGPTAGQAVLVRFGAEPTVNELYAVSTLSGNTVVYVTLAHAAWTTTDVPIGQFMALPGVIGAESVIGDDTPRVSVAILLDGPATPGDLAVVSALGARFVDPLEGVGRYFINALKIPLSALKELERHPQFKSIEIYGTSTTGV